MQSIYKPEIVKNNIELYNNINQLLTTYQSGDELEIRFGYYDNNYFRSSISYNRYINLLNFFSNNKDYKHTFISNTINMYSNGIRQIITNDSDSITIKKNKKNHIDDHQLGIRIALSNEKTIPEPPNNKYIKKVRNRHTFTHNSNMYKIDITIDSLPNSKQCQYELEYLKQPSADDVIQMIDTFRQIY